jgi:hypothetical protein
MLGRVTKTLQPSSISPHTFSHHDQHQEVAKGLKRKERSREKATKLRNSKKNSKNSENYRFVYIDLSTNYTQLAIII